MNGFKKLVPALVRKFDSSSLFSKLNFASSMFNLSANGSQHFASSYSAVNAVNLKNVTSLCELAKKSRVVRKEAQAALLDYLHSTRSLQFVDAENMSKNTPEFLDRLLKKVEVDADDCDDVGRSFTRFLRYHPINEFEPFFEGIGLEPSEYSSYLPRNLIFLSDDQLLLENYYVLCNYGIPRKRIGKIYREAKEVFRFDYGVMQSKIRAFENLGFNQSLVVKIIASSPYLLKDTTNVEFHSVLDKLKLLGIGYDWLEEHMSLEDSYDWKSMLDLMGLLGGLGLSEEQIGETLNNHHDMLFDCSGNTTRRLFGLLYKFGSTESDLKAVLLEFPGVSVNKFITNLCNCYRFFVEIKMPVQEIGKMFRSYPKLLGTCELKRLKSLLSLLNCGVGHLREMVTEDPYVLEKFVLGLRVDRLSRPNKVVHVRTLKTDFLLNLGFDEESEETERALKAFRGKGMELQERFDCLVENGLSREEVIAMVKIYPQILNQKKEVIESKVSSFVKNLGYSVSDLVTYPAVLSYTTQRVKLRLLTYKWLKEQRVVQPNLALSTLLSCSEDFFVRNYVRSHPKGFDFWSKLKKKIDSS